MTTPHKPGCPALGGYGHGIEPCCCGADQHERDSRELRELCEARDTARRERDDAKAALAAAEARNATLTDESARLDWLLLHLPGKALRAVGVMWDERGDARLAIDAARAAASISTKEGNTHADPR